MPACIRLLLPAAPGPTSPIKRFAMKCISPECSNDGSYYLIEIAKRQIKKENLFCYDHGAQYTTNYPWRTKSGDGIPGRYEGAACFDLEFIFFNGQNDLGQIVYLREVGKSRLFSFSTGVTEANLILNLVRGPLFSPPLPHVATVSIIKSLGGRSECVLVDEFDLQGQFPIFKAKLLVLQGERQILETIRVSDGVALALAAGIPFFVSESVLLAAPERSPS